MNVGDRIVVMRFHMGVEVGTRGTVQETPRALVSALGQLAGNLGFVYALLDGDHSPLTLDRDKIRVLSAPEWLAELADESR